MGDGGEIVSQPPVSRCMEMWSVPKSFIRVGFAAECRISASIDADVIVQPEHGD